MQQPERHPVVTLLLDSLQTTKTGVVFVEGGQARVEEALRAHAEDPEIVSAALAIIHIAHRIDTDLHAREIAVEILSMLDRFRVRSSILRNALATRQADVLAETFLKQTSNRRAPLHDARPPKGTKPLRELLRTTAPRRAPKRPR